MSVWFVEAEGDIYEGNNLLAVFSTKEKAEAYRDLRNSEFDGRLRVTEQRVGE